MQIINYTTGIDVFKTVGEIQGILVKNGARCVMVEYDEQQPAAISFTIDTANVQGVSVRLPARPRAVEKILKRMKDEKKGSMKVKPDFEQACRVAWRIIKDWIEVQMSIVQTEQAEMVEIFMPYIVDTQSGQTLFERLKQSQFLLPEK